MNQSKKWGHNWGILKLNFLMPSISIEFLFSKAELNYIVTEKELLAIVHSLNKSRNYITRYRVFLHIDHETIKYLMNKHDVNYQIFVTGTTILSNHC